MSEPQELDLSELTTDEYQEKISDAIDGASDQGQLTWLTCQGKRIAAIVPVDAAEYYEQVFTGKTSAGRHRAAAAAPEASG